MNLKERLKSEPLAVRELFLDALVYGAAQAMEFFLQRLAETAPQKPPEGKPSPSPPGESSQEEREKLRRRAWAIARRVGFGEVAMKQMIRSMFGVDSSKGLSVEQLRALVEALEDIERGKKDEQPSGAGSR